MSDLDFAQLSKHLIDEYDKALKTLEEQSQASARTKIESITVSLLKCYLIRDHLQELLDSTNQPTRDDLDLSVVAERFKHQISNVMWTKLVVADQRLRSIAEAAFRNYPIDLAMWQPHSSEVRYRYWWWRLYDDLFMRLPRDLITRRMVTMYVIAVGIFLLMLPLVSSTATTIAQALLNFVTRFDISQLGIESIAPITLIIQLLLGGGLSITFADRLARAVNYTFLRTMRRLKLQGWWRAVLMRIVPLSRVLVGTIIFVLLTLALYYLVRPRLAELFRSSAEASGQTLTSTRYAYQDALIFDPEAKATYSVNLTRLATRYEFFGNKKEARHLYEEALQAEPNLVVAKYLLVELLLKTPPEEDPEAYALALSWLDDATSKVQAPDANYETLFLKSADNLAQMEVLLLTSRGKAFLQLGKPELALVDLRDAETLTRKPSHNQLFVTVDNKKEDVLGRLSTAELNYLLVKCYLLLAESSVPADAAGYQEGAINALGGVTRLADHSNSQERLWAQEAGELVQRYLQTHQNP